MYDFITKYAKRLPKKEDLAEHYGLRIKLFVALIYGVIKQVDSVSQLENRRSSVRGKSSPNRPSPFYEENTSGVAWPRPVFETSKRKPPC